ncbi:MAG: MFS transporter [Candidatus Doudnabacteria bacterium]
MTFKSYLDVLKNIDFTKLWISQAASQLTNYLLSFAILIKVFQLTNSSAAVSSIIIAFGLGTVFFGGVAGVYADRFDRKWLLTLINFLQAGSVALYFVVGGSLWGLVIVTFLYASLNQFYLPAEAPSIPILVPKNQLLIANSYFAFTGSAALILGFAAAGPITVIFGPSAPYLTAVLLLLLAGLSTLSLPSLPPAKKVNNPYSLDRVWHEFKEGVVHLWENKQLHFPLLSLIAIQIVTGMMVTIAPVFIQQAIGINLNEGSLLVVAPLGLGILIGALFLGLEERRFRKKDLIFAGFLGMGVMIFALSFINFITYKYFYYSAIALIIGFSNAHIFAPSHSLIQTYALAHIRGRIYGTLYVLLQVAATMPTIIIGLLADRISLSLIVGGLGVLLLIFGLSIRPSHLTSS